MKLNYPSDHHVVGQKSIGVNRGCTLAERAFGTVQGDDRVVR